MVNFSHFQRRWVEDGDDDDHDDPDDGNVSRVQDEDDGHSLKSVMIVHTALTLTSGVIYLGDIFVSVFQLGQHSAFLGLFRYHTFVHWIFSGQAYLIHNVKLTFTVFFLLQQFSWPLLSKKSRVVHQPWKTH